MVKISADILQKGKVVPVIEAANEIGVHFTTIYRWVQKGEIIFITFGGNIFIPVMEVERIKKERLKKEQAAEA